MNRREALIAAFGAVACSRDLRNLPLRYPAASVALGDPETLVQTLLAKELPGVKEGNSTVSLSVLRVFYAPGGSSRAHTHSSAAFVYVIRGVIESQLEGEELQRYSTGEYFFEPAHHKHLIARNASSTEPAEFLAIFVGHADLPLTIPLGDGRSGAE